MEDLCVVEAGIEAGVERGIGPAAAIKVYLLRGVRVFFQNLSTSEEKKRKKKRKKKEKKERTE